ncbi:MAG: LPS assembly lipoprotein LptE [Reichenbachiella sp.]
MNWKINLLILIIFAGINSSCGVYSFTGATIGAETKTISIPTFFNNAPLGPSNMSITFTEQIRDYYLQNTSLVLVDSDGDLQLEGSIENYTLTPVAVTASDDNIDLTSLTRITIYVKCAYVNVNDDTFDFDKSFSFFVDFDQDKEDLSSNEEEFVEEIFDQIILDIFNSSVANW